MIASIYNVEIVCLTAFSSPGNPDLFLRSVKQQHTTQNSHGAICFAVAVAVLCPQSPAGVFIR